MQCLVAAVSGTLSLDGLMTELLLLSSAVLSLPFINNPPQQSQTYLDMKLRFVVLVRASHIYLNNIGP